MTMNNEIERLKVSGMAKGAHLDYMKTVADMAEADPVAAEKLKSEAAALRQRLSDEDKCMALPRKSVYSAQIAEQDRLRDSCYLCYKATVKAMLAMPEGDMLAAARKLWQNMKDRRLDTKAQLYNESGNMSTLCDELTGRLAGEVKTLGLTALVSDMAAANTQVHDLMSLRSEELSKRAKGALTSARQQTDKAYKALVKKANALATVDADSDYTPFIKKMNQLIKEYRQKVLAKRKKAANTTAGGPEPD